MLKLRKIPYLILLLCLLTSVFLLLGNPSRVFADACSDRSGVCMDVSECTPAKADPPGTPVQPIAGLCAGPANIQCCVFTADAGSGGGSAGAQKLPNPLGTTSVYDILGRVIKAALGLTGAIALVMFIYGGFLMMFSGGNPSAVKKGKDTLVMAVLGLVVIFASYAIVNFIITSITK
jgi:hypothetical protein